MLGVIINTINKNRLDKLRKGVYNQSMKLNKWFKINGSDREFMYLYSTTDKIELQQVKDFVKAQGDIYRVTKRNGKYTIWDARC